MSSHPVTPKLLNGKGTKMSNAQRIKIAKMAYSQEEEDLQKRSHTSFGKLILATEKSKPIFSIGTAPRFNYQRGPKSPGPDTYSPSDVEKYKYKTTSKWKIGSSQRPPLSDKERFTYYNHRYSERDDLSKLPKKWNKLPGGSIDLEPRVKYDFSEKTPGPGRYEPSLKLARPKLPSYYIGERTKVDPLLLKTGTNYNVGPGKYKIAPGESTLSNWHASPKYSVGKGKRRGLYNPKWTKNETYYNYHAFGDQVMSKKRTEAREKFGKSTRRIEQKRGVFRSMMERQPVRISIPMPKI